MMLVPNVGLVDSYNSGRIKKESYGPFIHGFKFNLGEYSTSNPFEAYFDTEIIIKYININGNTIIDEENSIGSFDGFFADLTYRNDGYGLGVANIVDIINNSNLLTPYNITFHPAGSDKIVVRTREKTRFSIVFKDHWEKEGNAQGSLEWTLIGNYPSSFAYPNRELVIGDWIGNYISAFDGQDIQSVVDVHGYPSYWL